MSDKTKWFADCGWGVFCHWLAPQPSSNGGVELSSEEWNRRVDAFDVEGLAQQLEAVGAPYFFITIGQNSGHYISPNSTYDQLVGIEPSKCSRRDLVADLYDVLHPRGIELLVYLPSGAPDVDPMAVSRLEWECGFEGGAWGNPRTGKRLAVFQKHWQQVIREWSERWGTKVRGWWIDGCYFADAMYRHDDEPNFRSLTAALKAGNADSLVAFNPGVTVPIICHSECEDYSAGELSTALTECSGPWVERNGHRARYHVLSYLGESWCKGTPRFPHELVAGYTKHITSKGGVITWDVPIEQSGLIPSVFVEQLSSMGRACRAD
jgi:hypothetical protein